MEDWRKNIIPGDISKACQEAGTSRTTYYLSVDRNPARWTTAMCKVNARLKEIVKERADHNKQFA